MDVFMNTNPYQIAQLTMASLTTIILPHNSHLNSHSKLHSSHSLTLSSNLLRFQFRFHSIPRRCSGFRVSHAIPNPKFDFNLRNFNDDDDDDFNGRRRGRRTWKRRKGNRRSKQWWNVEVEEDDGEDEDERGFFYQVVDSLWILQVFRSYGWFSPIILISLLVTTGPKAFLMAFSIFFGLSLVIFTYQKLQEWLAGSPKPQNRRKRSKFGRRSDTSMEEEVDQDGQQGKGNKKRDYQSGATRNNGSFYTSQKGNVGSGNYFGGWDELVRDDETQRVHRPSQENGRPKIMEERLSRSMQDRDLPLLLRLLVAVFPFLASWTNLL